MSAWKRMAIVAGACAMAIASGAEAAPLPRRYALVWTRAEGAEPCPDSASIEKALEKALGPISFVPLERAEVVVEAVVRKTNTFRAVLTLRDANGHLQGERTLESDDATCHELVQSVALVAAVMIDPEAAGRDGPPVEPPPEEPGDELRPATPPAPEQQPSPRPAESASTPRTPHTTVATPIAAVATGLLPTIANGVGLDVWYTAQRYATFGVGLRYWAPQTVEIAGRSLGAEFQLLDAIVSYCPVRAEWNALEVFGCAQLDLGLLSAKGFGGTTRSVARRPLVAPGAAVRVAYGLGDRWRLSGVGAVEVPFRRDQFDYRGTDITMALFEQSAVSARFEIGLGFAW